MDPCCLSHSRAALVRWPRGDSPTPGSCVEAWTLVLVSSLCEAVSRQTPRSVPAVSVPVPTQRALVLGAGPPPMSRPSMQGRVGDAETKRSRLLLLQRGAHVKICTESSGLLN